MAEKKSKQLGKPIPITADDLKRARNRVIGVGIELEGGWSELPRGVQLVRDGSVNIPGLPGQNVGELPSPPLEPKQVEKWLTKHYPQHVNETCGMHVHLSFNTALTYMRTMDPSYGGTIVTEMAKWAEAERLPASHPIWSRLRGESRYCQLLFQADEQILALDKAYAQDRPGHRYTIVNYCWSRYGTTEIRLLPMMTNAAQAYSAISHLINVVNAYLLVTGRKKRERTKPITVAMNLDGEAPIERRVRI